MSDTWGSVDWHLRCRRSDNAGVIERVVELLDVARPNDNVLVGGDLTESGREAEYAEARRLLMRMRSAGLNLLLSPGNHDFGLHGLLFSDASVARWNQLVREVGALDTLDCNGMRYRAIDTCKHTFWPTDTARQRVGPAIRRRIPGWCQDAKNAGLSLVLVGHAWPYCTDETLLLEDRKEFLALVEGRCHYIGGHTHLEERRVVAGSVMLCLGKLERSGFRRLAIG